MINFVLSEIYSPYLRLSRAKSRKSRKRNSGCRKNETFLSGLSFRAYVEIARAHNLKRKAFQDTVLEAQENLESEHPPWLRS